MNNRTAALLLAPACVILFVLTIVPALGVIGLSFFEWSGNSSPTFVGLDNFSRLIEDDSFKNAAKVTFFFVSITSFIELFIGILLALMLERWPKWRNALRVIISLPLLLSPAIAGIIWKMGLNEQSGLFTQFLNQILSEPIRPLSSSFGTICTITCIDIWQWTPFVVLLVSLALEGAKEKTADIARIDGLSPRTSFRYVWTPIILPTVGIVALFRTTDALKVFDIVQTATAGRPRRG